jgi:hypothetical protein
MTERQVLERERDEDQRTSGDTGKNHTPWTKVRDKAWYTDPEKELDHAFYKNRLPLTIQMLQEVGIIYAQNVQKNVKNICAM